MCKVDAEPLGDDALEVDPAPARDAILLTIRAGLDDLCELSQLLRRKARFGTFSPVVDEALRTRGIETMDQSPKVWRSMPPIFVAEPRSIPSLTAASDRSRRLWLTVFDRRATPKGPPPHSPLAI
jgi:hypothetical protein